MEIDWTLFARYAAPIVALVVGAVINHLLEKRPKVVSFLAHASAVSVQPPTGAAFDVHTHSIVVRNAGRKPATNVRLGHRVLPNFSVYPSIPYVVNALPSGGSEILFPALVPGEQVIVNYLYYPPVVWSDINSYTKSDEGFANIIKVLPSPQAPTWAVRLALVLTLIGVVTVVYGAVELVRVAMRAWGGA